MATRVKSKFAILLLMLVLVTSALLFHAQDSAYQADKNRASSGTGLVTVTVVEYKDQFMSSEQNLEQNNEEIN